MKDELRTLTFRLQSPRAYLDLIASFVGLDPETRQESVRVTAVVNDAKAEMTIPLEEAVTAAKAFISYAGEIEGFRKGATYLRDKWAQDVCETKSFGGCSTLTCPCHAIRATPLQEYKPLY